MDELALYVQYIEACKSTAESWESISSVTGTLDAVPVDQRKDDPAAS